MLCSTLSKRNEPTSWYGTAPSGAYGESYTPARIVNSEIARVTTRRISSKSRLKNIPPWYQKTNGVAGKIG